MSKRFLVTTTIEEIIPQNEPILFLGEWCRSFKNINKLDGSYMKPHMHPITTVIEKMHLISGSFKLIFFDEKGLPKESYDIDEKNSKVEVPGYTWHTYIMTSKSTIVFETMMGKYNPSTWKEMAAWAPDENSNNSNEYLQFLKNVNI